ncbi:hypothetical protein Lalb_Chr10g0093651 [Lupinus albus]|uniref:Uncharacterized protein n=1 Tax=Lupinus albus TaxID=3870 RepID=A0A6A4PUC6_LUPAL|nr:hypothetical protein Lalb_Chr10g0093651 [Lupinus albus]
MGLILSYFLLIPHCSSIPLVLSYIFHTLSYLVLGPITTLKSPFDHYVHVLVMLMLETCQTYGCVCFHEVP